MRTLDHQNLVPLEVSAVIPVLDRARSVVSEVLIVMPFYKVRKYEHSFKNMTTEM